MSDTTIWSYIAQLLSALKAIHGKGLACRALHASKVIVTGPNRVRIGAATGVLDVLAFDGGANVRQRQADDLAALAKLVLLLCTRNAAAERAPARAIEQLAAAYGPELKNFVVYLLTPHQTYPVETFFFEKKRNMNIL